MNKGSLYWNPDTQYEEYVAAQINRASRSKKLTHKRDGARRWAHDHLKNELKLNWKTMLCIGARSEAEPMFWRNLGYEADAIDLIPCSTWSDEKASWVSSDYSGWEVCDMSKMHLNDYLKNKKYDLVYMSDALEHCLDLDGFITGLNLVCDKYFFSLCPYQSTPYSWDVAVHPFMAHREEGNIWGEDGLIKEEVEKRSIQNIEKCFSKFNIINVHRIGERNKLIMTLGKKQV
jgi:hypothetical protein